MIRRFRKPPVAVSGLLCAALLLGASSKGADAACNLGQGPIKHIIYVQFDNTHFRRDRTNVPSDLEQMPNLLNFIESKGSLDSNDHTVLISHTATGILTSLTGVYPDRMGVPVSNSFRYFKPDGSTNPAVSFAYWTDPIFDPTFPASPTDTTPNMLAENGKNAPAPWVPFTRAGCDVGMVATANAVLENINPDIPKVFGAGSAEDLERKSNSQKAAADFVGIAIHCASRSPLCNSPNHSNDDLLPDEPGGGYSGFKGLFGHKYAVPAINGGSASLTDLEGNTIQDPNGNVGFPGFDGMGAWVSLAYVAKLQEAGTPVTFAYISDAHDAHPSGPAYAPGETGYVQALARYNQAFGNFFARLTADGITEKNTLFIFTVDEGDHFAGGQPTNPGCDGVNVPCTYAPGQVGEVATNLKGLLVTQKANSTAFTVHSDDAPTVYITGNPGRTDTETRQLERDMSGLTATNPFTLNIDTIAERFADPVGMKALHMITSDPARTPTFTMFANADYFLFVGAPNCASPCTSVNPGFAWNHGDYQDEIANTWLGVVGPGVTNRGVVGPEEIWSDHTDVRPTVLSLVGLNDDYGHDGRVLVELLDASANPMSLRRYRGVFQQLARVYKQINAPFGQFGQDTLIISTAAIKSSDAGDATYQSFENEISSWTAQRDTLAAQIKGILDAAAFNGVDINVDQAHSLIRQSEALLATVHSEAQGL